MGIIYLIGSGLTDNYKIGVTKSTPDRIRGLQTGNPLELKLIDYYESENYQKIETVLHRTLKDKKYIPEDFKKLKGEWFKLTNEDVLGFRKKCIKIEKNLEFIKQNSTHDFKH